MDVKVAVMEAGKMTGYHPLKEEQSLCIEKFVGGNDVFCILPTGFGKTACFACLPCVFDLTKNKSTEDKSIVIVVSPLTALIKDHVETLMKRNISVGYLDTNSSIDERSDISKGSYSLIFMSPEMLVGSWRSILINKVYQKRLVGLVIDEAHCVVKWGLSFRECFSRISEVRSLMDETVHIMALTATASSKLREEVSSLLGLVRPYLIVRSPDKENIIYTVQKIGNIELFAKHILTDLKAMRTLLPRIIVFCKHKADCGRLYTYLRVNMGIEFTDPPGASLFLPEHRMVDMFFQGVEPEIREAIVRNFTTPSKLRIVISTVAFGMGIDCRDVRLIVHLGPPSDVEMYVQETGRGGRDGVPSYAILLSTAKLLQQCSESIVSYTNNSTICRREMLFSQFDEFVKSPCNVGCRCCDICIKNCTCTRCNSNLQEHYTFMPFMF